MAFDPLFMDAAIGLSERWMTDGLSFAPFGAVVVRNNEVIGQGCPRL